MKFRNDMLFAHPVLSDFSDDYVEANFTSGFSIEVDDRNLTIHSTIVFTCDDLVALIDEGVAGCGYYLACPRTYQNRLVEVPLGEASTMFDADLFFGRCLIRAVLWSKSAKANWKCSRLHSEYKGVVDIPGASILAFGPEFRFTVDRERLRPFESIFLLAPDDRKKPGEIGVDAEESKITIYVHPHTKSSIEDIRGPTEGRAVLLNAVYFPAIVEILSRLQDDEGQYQDKTWFRIFTAKCDAAGVDYQAGSAFENAQKLLNFPFQRIEEIKDRLFG